MDAERILNTINKEKNYNKLLLTFKNLSEKNNTIKKLQKIAKDFLMTLMLHIAKTIF